MESTSGEEHQVPSSNRDEVQLEIRQKFDEAQNSPCDLWFEREDGKILNAFVNGDWTWLMYRRDEDDTGFSSRNPDYTGPEETVLPYILSNGQRDEVPVSWTITTDEAMRAVECFLRTGEKAPWIIWHDDKFP